MRKINLYLYILLITVMTISCGNIKNNSSLNDNQSIVDDWKAGCNIKPDNSIDTIAMKAHYTKYTDRWKAALNFLNNSKLDSLPVGEYEILGKDVYAIVSEYYPKDEVDCNFEAHKKYIDLQYVIQGEEKMGIAKLKDVVPITVYDEDKDITFYKKDATAFYKKATVESFFLFFPEDAHRPSMKTKDNIKVKKIVIKVRYE